MDISIIICTYNRCESLKDTLNSLLAQELDGEFSYEVIVVDNNSKDKTKEIVEGYISKFNGKLKYLFEPKQGKSYALNKGINEAGGEIIAFTDDDCVVDRAWVKEIAKTFKKNNAGVAGGIINPIWLSEKPRWLGDRLYGRLAIQNYGDTPFIVSSKSNLPFGANFSFKKDLFYRYGLFDEKMKLAMDTEICLRLLKNGVKIFYNPQIAVSHKIDPSRLKKSYFYRWSYQRGSLYKHIIENYKRKFYHPFGIPLWLILSLIKEIVKSLNIFIKESEKVYHRSVLFAYIGMVSSIIKDNFNYNYKK